MVALQPEPMGWTAQARDTVARVIIEQAQAGERDPERLCEAALKALRPSRQGAVTDPNPSGHRGKPTASTRRRRLVARKKAPRSGGAKVDHEGVAEMQKRATPCGLTLAWVAAFIQSHAPSSSAALS